MRNFTYRPEPSPILRRHAPHFALVEPSAIDVDDFEGLRFFEDLVHLVSHREDIVWRVIDDNVRMTQAPIAGNFEYGRQGHMGEAARRAAPLIVIPTAFDAHPGKHIAKRAGVMTIAGGKVQ
jgi:hypothetical protein